jgi:Glycosyl hydrolase catalytic core
MASSRQASRPANLRRILPVGVTVAVALAGAAAPVASAATASHGRSAGQSHSARPTGSAHQTPAPVLRVSGATLKWTKVNKIRRYELAVIRHPATTRNTTYQIVKGTSFTPTAGGRTIKYGLRADVGNARWSKEVNITFRKTNTAPSHGTVASPAGPATATVASPAGPATANPTAPGSTGTGTNSPMLVGLNESGWGANGVSDVASSFNFDRVDISSESANDFWTRGLAVDALFAGPYNTGGVSAINPTSWAANTVSTFQSECAGSATHCPAVEVLNEPYGSWFWGANATSSANEAAYAHLLVDTWTAFHNQYGAASPKILAAYGSDNSWWQGIVAAVPNIDNYVDGVTVHPYGGTGSVASSALGDRALVADAHQTTGKPLWISEFGWPTALGQPATGDSLQWGFSAQATNTYNFVTWLRSLGYVAAAADFQYRDYGTNAWYGVETSTGTKKPSWTALAEAANQQACTVCA